MKLQPQEQICVKGFEMSLKSQGVSNKFRIEV